jgi:hypothetical protein
LRTATFASTVSLAAFAARFAGLLGGELVRRALVVRGLATFAGDLALLVIVHRRKATLRTLVTTLAPTAPALVAATLAAL